MPVESTRWVPVPNRLVVADQTADPERRLRAREEIMQILEAFDLTGSFRDEAELVGCSHDSVAAWIAKRDADRLPDGEAG